MTTHAAEQVRMIASAIFNTFGQDGSASSPPENMDDWDSMLRLNLVLALEEHFAVEFTAEEIEAMKTLSAFAEVVEMKCD
jgi:acyl carrier protein